MLLNPFTQTPAKIGVIGLGYVGLPLAVALAAKYEVVGFDINRERIAELKVGHDRTLEATSEELAGAKALSFASEETALAACNVFIVTVPTPIDRYKRPDLTALLAASGTVGRVIGKGGVAIFESTVYPGATEEDCIPVIEAASGLKFNEDFFAGYSPERANPGDRQHRLSSIIKVTAGSTPQAAAFIDALYGAVVTAGTHLASSIRVAEAAKVIENTQRDLNIALINEFALIFNRLGIDTQEVLAAAGTKWNFLRFTPGLVGGHCIGVDPYYLTSKAEDAGYHPQVILAGRRINDGMGSYIAQELVKTMIRREIQVRGARVLVMGLTFKENCPDLRNTRVIDIVRELEEYEVAVDVHEPWADQQEALAEYGVALSPALEPGVYDAIIVAVAHAQFQEMGVEAIRALGKPGAVLYDVKAVFPQGTADLRL
ncbi:nucleotide sugar dehydrogenase [Phenylobacterium sp.]|uniref:nucleotide sugar dehydrogenase n=1 Tax=Phenylobacterium sp. TaxID=1871053 RepID=UPI00273048C5|nr:nucleotide sugar dehydrogenase [Phenylobacterium sp.]MDP1598205.1 nucleotide sugar dehydrogenase [Phenylobacterium sp.]MDP3594731.1 nucleotide sugar dehydrogenase [Phenylobacterium sp.]